MCVGMYVRVTLVACMCLCAMNLRLCIWCGRECWMAKWQFRCFCNLRTKREEEVNVTTITRNIGISIYYDCSFVVWPLLLWMCTAECVLMYCVRGMVASLCLLFIDVKHSSFFPISVDNKYFLDKLPTDFVRFAPRLTTQFRFCFKSIHEKVLNIWHTAKSVRSVFQFMKIIPTKEFYRVEKSPTVFTCDVWVFSISVFYNDHLEHLLSNN